MKKQIIKNIVALLLFLAVCVSLALLLPVKATLAVIIIMQAIFFVLLGNIGTKKDGYGQDS